MVANKVQALSMGVRQGGVSQQFFFLPASSLVDRQRLDPPPQRGRQERPCTPPYQTYPVPPSPAPPSARACCPPRESLPPVPSRSRPLWHQRCLRAPQVVLGSVGGGFTPGVSGRLWGWGCKPPSAAILSSFVRDFFAPLFFSIPHCQHPSALDRRNSPPFRPMIV